jgi:hypothetical protein
VRCGRVLAHGGYQDAVTERSAAYCQRLEKSGRWLVGLGILGYRTRRCYVLWGEVLEARDALVVVLRCHSGGDSGDVFDEIVYSIGHKVR